MQIKRGICDNCGRAYTVHGYELDTALTPDQAKERVENAKAFAVACGAIYLDMSVDTQVVCPHCKGLLLARIS